MKTEQPQHTQGDKYIKDPNYRQFILLDSGQHKTYNMPILIQIMGNDIEGLRTKVVESLNTLEQNKKKLELFEELVGALKEMYETTEPEDVNPDKKYNGLTLGNGVYVGSKTSPSNKAIHRALNMLKKAQEI